MSSFYQKTIKSVAQFSGAGLHTGKRVEMKLLPAAPNHGIVFKRTDLKRNNLISAIFDNVSKAVLCTNLQNEFGVSVLTVEHLMAALCGEKIDNILIEINSAEVPIMDGSAKDFVFQIRKIGTKIYDTPKKFIKVLKKYELVKDNKFISIEPCENNLEIDFEIVYKNNELIGKQRKSVNVLNENLEQVYNSRTFCLFEDIDKVKKMGLGVGGSLDNAIIVKGNKILNEGGLRYKDEFVMHKILDCIGDLMLAKYNILGKVKCSQGGHSLTNEMLRGFLSDSSHFSIVEFKEKKLPNSPFYGKPVAVSA